MSLESLDEYGKDFVNKIFKLLLTDKTYLFKIYDAINPEHYEIDTQKWIINKILEYYKIHNTPPTKDFLRVELKKHEDTDFQIRTAKNLQDCYKIDIDECEYVKDEYRHFCINKALKEAILQSVDLMRYKEYDTISRLIEDAIKLRQDKEVGHMYAKDLDNRYQNDERTVIPFPFEEWNERTKGGMRVGDLILLFAFMGIGKTWVSVIFAAFALQMGFDVLFYSLELDEADIGKRFDARFTKIPLNDLDENLESVQEVLDSLEGELRIYRMKGSKKKFSYIKKHAKQLRDLDGFKPKMIVIDYIDKIWSEDGGERSYQQEEQLFDNIRDWGSDVGAAIVSGSQTGREGAREKVIENDRIGGSIKKGQIADMSFAFTRSRKDKGDNKVIVTWMKNRRGRDNWVDEGIFDSSNGYMEIIGEYNEEDNTRITTPSQHKVARNLIDTLLSK